MTAYFVISYVSATWNCLLRDLLCFMCIIIGHFFFNLFVSDREDLTRQIKDTSDKQLQNDLTKQLNSIVARMEAKGEQVVKLKRCQEAVTVYSLLLPS